MRAEFLSDAIDLLVALLRFLRQFCDESLEVENGKLLGGWKLGSVFHNLEHEAAEGLGLSGLAPSERLHLRQGTQIVLHQKEVVFLSQVQYLTALNSETKLPGSPLGSCGEVPVARR